MQSLNRDHSKHAAQSLFTLRGVLFFIFPVTAPYIWHLHFYIPLINRKVHTNLPEPTYKTKALA